jgi:hypothetical protein
MPVKSLFDPERISLAEYRLTRSSFVTPDNFNEGCVVGHQLDHTLKLGFNAEEKIARVEFSLSIKTNSNHHNKAEATGNFHFAFFYHIENSEELITLDKKKQMTVHADLSHALASLTYSTTRGVLLLHLQGTALHTFKLPIIHPSKLVKG